MTGYGRKQLCEDGRTLTLEIKSVNHRFLDMSFRIPRACGFMEDALRQAISQALHRGHVEAYVTYENLREDAHCVKLDKALAKSYFASARDISAEIGKINNVTVSDIIRMPGVLTQTDNEENSDAVTALLKRLCDDVLSCVVQMRVREGEALKSDLITHLDELEAITNSIKALAPNVPQAYREKLMARIEQAEISDVDPQRIAQEVAIFADKCAIDEELSRLQSHIAQMRQTMALEGECGRKLDFLTQELNREVNTIGSKALNIDITRYVLKAKGEIEKLREQVQNVE